MAKTKSRFAGPAAADYRRAVEELASIDPVTQAEAVLALVGDVLSEVPGLAAHRWELLLAMETALGQQASPVPLTPRDVIEGINLERVLRDESRRTVLENPMLTAEAVAVALGSTSVNPRQYANARRRRGELLGLPVKNRYLFPAFQLDLERRRVVPAVAEANEILGAADDPWGAASWWFSGNSYLGGATPASMVAEHADDGGTRALQAAQALVAPVG